MQNYKSGLNKMKHDLGILKIVYCTEEEEKKFDSMKKENTPILDEIYIDGTNRYYRYVDAGGSKQQTDELLVYRQIDYLRTIKNRITFIVVISVIFLLLWILSLLFGR